MTKTLTRRELAAVITDLLTNPPPMEDMDDIHREDNFVHALAVTVADHIGGKTETEIEHDEDGGHSIMITVDQADTTSQERWNATTTATEKALAGLVDAGENTLIAIGMGWDLGGAIEQQQAAITSAHEAQGTTALWNAEKPTEQPEIS